jgi:hypothetical protein
MAARHEASANISPLARWERAMQKLYPTSVAARKKGCPRGAFLGLCEEGLVKGVPVGHYTASRDNKAYAIRAVTLLAEGEQALSISALWHAVTNGSGKVHNSQMDVVLALWKNGLIVCKS